MPSFSFSLPRSGVQELGVPLPGQGLEGPRPHQPLPSKLFSLPFLGDTASQMKAPRLPPGAVSLGMGFTLVGAPAPL